VAVREVDPHDDGAFAAWFAVLDASLEHSRPGEPHWDAREQRELALAGHVPPGGDRPRLSSVRRLLHDPAGGAAAVTLPQRDNQHLAELVVEVHPGARRRGIGTGLLAEAERRAREAGRTSLSAMVDEPGPGTPGRAFAERHGFTCGLVEVRRDLALPTDAGRLAALEREALAASAGYEVRTWGDATPPELLEDRALLERRLSTDAPSGDQPYEEEDWDPARVLEREATHVRQGRRRFSAGALRDGRLVAFSELAVPLAVPEKAYQWGTLVLREHRGHRLGLLVKLAALRELTAASPATTSVTTWNADSNRPMIAVNEAMGFRTAGAISSWHRASPA